MATRPKSNEAEVVLRLLTERRVSAGLTQQDLANKLEWSVETVRKIESGARRADVMELREICIACGSSIHSFVVELEQATGG